MKKLVLLVLLAITLLVPCSAFSASYSLTWTANTEPDLAGYLIYVNNNFVEAVDKDQLTYTLDVGDTSINVIFITAIDYSGNESEKSNTAFIINKTAVVNDGIEPTKVQLSIIIQ
ncbi:MAG: hypothetical protein DRG78_09415 [Epsilonproteobacteria bacterium]|nr:MAG: hypothetical protein DRG78_09415 [Campylobacterota bacterium]